MNAKLIAATCTCCLLAAAAATAHAGDPAAGKEKSQACAACHGPDGNSASPEFPRIAGQHYDYLVKALIHYKTGARKNPIMAPQVEKLSRRDIEDLAAYYSSQKGLVTKY
ncbi:MAG TPA: cytochrome c [Burkholderiales bacterium]|nr:cytochrome c [Burkholderiales bacterium]